MLSYRHAFHAGNFADVLKHWVLVECIDYLKKKEKPFTYFDTHAGPGMYALDSDFAQKTHEYETGIARIWNDPQLPEVLQPYCDLVKSLNEPASLNVYPGSPGIAKWMLRETDRLVLSELHSTEYMALSENFSHDRRAEVWKEDGFNRTLKRLPPSHRRGLVLIDPPYELKEDYERVIDFLIAAQGKFAQGVYALWYPVVDRARIDEIERALKQSGIRAIALFELGLEADTDGRGMTSSGMIVINPPWTLKKQIDSGIDYLVNTLGKDGAFSRSEILVEE
ncbi:MAG TPA: 23S rRNA (adenine(2030)-N(6))-methyltransferase RlmJ [Opitutae bacterium]|nr:23S rRNA (adenine(2030)-N(6))-methyltransferase RlmJ [Opitutae bacterium]